MRKLLERYPLLRDEEFRETLQIWSWRIQMVIAAVLFIWFRDVWEVVSLLYLVEVSIYANAVSKQGVREGIRAKKEAAKSNGD